MKVSAPPKKARSSSAEPGSRRLTSYPRLWAKRTEEARYARLAASTAWLAPPLEWSVLLTTMSVREAVERGQRVKDAPVARQALRVEAGAADATVLVRRR